MSQNWHVSPPVVSIGGGIRIEWRNGRETVTKTTSYGFAPGYGDFYDLTNEDAGGPPAIIHLNRPRRPDDPVITALYIDEKGRPCLIPAISPQDRNWSTSMIRDEMLAIQRSPARAGS